MGLFSGKDGSAKFAGQRVKRVKNWSLDSTVETLEATDLGDPARVYIAGLKSATGSLSIHYHDDDASLRQILDNVITTGEPKVSELELIWGSQKIVLRAWITSASLTCTTGEVMSADLSFTMNGDYQTVAL